MDQGTIQASMNIFDLGVLGILGLSALLSFFRGFVREILSLGAWVGASIITLYWFPDVAAWIQPQTKSTMVASGLAAMGTFMSSLVVISIFNSILLKFLKTGSEIGLLDNGLGLAFGLARGALLIAVAYFIMTVVVPEKDYPVWVHEAQTRPYVEEAASWLAEIAPKYLDDISPLKDGEGSGAVLNDPPSLDRAIDDRNTSEDAEPSPRWESMKELQDRMRNN